MVARCPPSLYGNSSVSFPDDACHWGDTLSPLIDLGEAPESSFPWDCQPGYMEWWEQMSHPYLDYRSPRQDPTTPAPDVPLPPLPSNLATRAQVISAQLRLLAIERAGLSDDLREQLMDFAGQLTGARPLRHPPIARGAPHHTDPVVHDFVFEEGSSSRAQDDQPDS